MRRQHNRYKGWTVTDEPFPGARPVTGRWRAERFGVGMCAGTYDAIIHMIDNRGVSA